MISISKLNRKSSTAWVVAWLIWPIGALILSLKNQNRNTFFFVLGLFCIFYGWMFIVPEDVAGAADSARYARDLRNMHSLKLSFNEFFAFYFNVETTKLDIYQPIVTWVISFFTQDPKWLFSVFAIVFSYFYIRNLQIASALIPKFNNWIIIIFFFGLILVNPIWNINGVRMWTATHVFIYGLFHYLFINRKNGYFWLFASALFHFSFLFALIVFLIWKIFPKWQSIYFVLFISTGLLQEIDFVIVKDLLFNLPEIFHGKVNSYYGDEYLENFESDPQDLSIHVRVYFLMKNVFLYLCISIIFIHRKLLNAMNPNIELLISFILFFGSISNIYAMLPSGGRFLVIVDFLIYLPLFLLLNTQRPYLTKRIFKAISIPVLIYLIIFNIRVGLDYAGVGMIISNPIIGFFMNDQVPIIQTIKNLLSG